MKRGLVNAVVVILLCDLVVVGVRLASGANTHVFTRVRVPPTRTIVVPPPGQADVTGSLVSLAADAEVLDTVPTPFTVGVPDPGTGGATIEGALVDGTRATIVWDGGRPLPLTGDPGTGLDPSPAHVELDAGGLTVSLDGASRPFMPGRYTTTATVAVGSGGLATPRDGVTFTADARTAMTTRGGATVRLTPRPVRADGPGRLSARGTFRVVTAGGTRTATTIVFGPGAFRVALRPAGAGYELSATLNGPLQAGGEGTGPG